MVINSIVSPKQPNSKGNVLFFGGLKLFDMMKNIQPVTGYWLPVVLVTSRFQVSFLSIYLFTHDRLYYLFLVSNLAKVVLLAGINKLRLTEGGSMDYLNGVMKQSVYKGIKQVDKKKLLLNNDL